MPLLPASNYPTLTTVANLARSLVNDDKKGATGTPGEGWNLTNTSIQLQNFMNSAIRDLYNDIRIIGQQTLIKDNYLVLNLPPVNSPLGVGVPNPAVQTALGFNGFYDGLMMNVGGNPPTLTLPSDLLFPLELWSRPTGSELPFTKMKQVSGALPSYIQNQYLTQWEWRTDQIWMNGAVVPYDLRIRYLAIYQDLASLNTDWDDVSIPVMNCQDLVAWKICVLYASRLGGASIANAIAQEQSQRKKFQQQTIRDRQYIDYRFGIFKPNAGGAGDVGRSLYY